MAVSLNYTEKITISKIKRIFDIIISLFLILLFSPIYIITIISLFIEHVLRGQIFASLFYKETRISWGEKFTFIKFNIFKPEIIDEMKKNNIFIHTKQLENDKNNLLITGYLIKQIYFDELPQLFAILKGDMSLVGPRPVNLEVYDSQLLRNNYSRYILKAGLTGNFQSQKGMAKKSEQELDYEYIHFCKNNPSYRILIFDIKILLKTIIVVFKARGI